MNLTAHGVMHDRIKLPGLITLVLLAAPCLAHGEIPNDAIGRLFLTPAERAQIEQTRGQEQAADISFGASVSGDADRPIDEAMALNGLVRRADGNDIVWVNGQIIGDRLGTSTGIKIRQGPDANHSVVLESAVVPRPVRLKPGQAWDRNTNSVVDCYRCASIDSGTAKNDSDESDMDE